jgi:uncharacterized Zn finger protein
MAIIEVSEDGVRRAVGGEVFGQAEDWVGKVSGLETDGPVISATVDGIPVSVRILPDGITGECECPAHGLCVHAAAAVLAWPPARRVRPTRKRWPSAWPRARWKADGSVP